MEQVKTGGPRQSHVVDGQVQRRCGDCQLCCKLLPMNTAGNAAAAQAAEDMRKAGFIERLPFMIPDFDKPAGQRCPHQKHQVGCMIYRQRPFGCRMWICAWLAGEDLSRPDHSHFVLDPISDIIRAGGEPMQAIQVWVDKAYPDAWRDERLLAFIERKKMPALIRYSASEGFAIFPPSVTGHGWVENRNTTCDTTTTLHQRWNDFLDTDA